MILKILNSQRAFFALIFPLYFLFLYLLYLKTGIIDSLEAEKYIRYANDIAKGDFSEMQEKYTYLSFVLFLVLSLKIGGTGFAVILQILLNLIAAVFLKRIVFKLTGSQALPALAILFFLFNYLIQYWTLTLYTESFFTSMIIFMIYFLFCKEINLKRLPLLFLFLIIVTFARPQGLMFTIPAFVFIVQSFVSFNKKNLILFSSLLTAGIFTIIFLIKSHCEDVVRPIMEGSVICGFPGHPVTGALPVECTIKDAYSWLLQEHSFLYIIELFFRKIFTFFNLNRDYFSLSHNLMLLPNYLLYPLALLSLFRIGKSSKEVYFLFFIICLNVLLTGFTFNEWHGRFMAPLLPVFIMLSMIGLKAVFQPGKIKK